MTDQADNRHRIIIRDAAEDDLSVICDIEKRSFTHAWSIEGYRKELEQESTFIRVAVEEAGTGTITGVICFRIVSGEGYLMKLNVAEKFRRQGIGSMMLNMFIETCEKRRVSDTVLDVSKENTAALSLYEKQGFVVAGHNHRTDSFVMTRRSKDKGSS